MLVSDQHTRASVDNVVVRITNSPLSDGADNRELRLSTCGEGQFVVVSAPGYETGFMACNGSNTYYIFLSKLNEAEDSNYTWTPAAGNCDRCHDKQVNLGYNEVEEWEKSAHATVFVDPYFASMYRGTSVSGQVQGTGFKLNHPNDAGDCAFCHAPTTILNPQSSTDLSSYYPRLAGTNGEGITCDICHKVLAVGDFYAPNSSGIRSFIFRRLSKEFVTGPFSNILLPPNGGNKHSSTCTKILSESEFCAVCHYGQFNGVTVYNSYGEWKQSIYGNNPGEASYKTCQDCHMSHMDAGDVATPRSARSACSERTERFQNFDHNLMNVDSSEPEIPGMIKNAASLGVKVRYEPNENNSLIVRVELENTKAGHKFPTDSPLRQLILVVAAKDQFDVPLIPVNGEKIPAWGGTKDLSGSRGYAGQPGTIYANLLDAANPLSSAAYWDITTTAQPLDTRLSPRQQYVSSYSFVMPDLGDVDVTVQLIYRFAFLDLMDQKGWVRPDIVVATASCPNLFPEPGKEILCPAVDP